MLLPVLLLFVSTVYFSLSPLSLSFSPAPPLLFQLLLPTPKPVFLPLILLFLLQLHPSSSFMIYGSLAGGIKFTLSASDSFTPGLFHGVDCVTTLSQSGNSALYINPLSIREQLDCVLPSHNPGAVDCV